MSFIVTSEAPCTCCTLHRTARIEHTSSGNGYTVTRALGAAEPAKYFELPDGVSIAGAWDASHIKAGKHADELEKLLEAIDAHSPSSEAIIGGQWTIVRTHKRWDNTVKRWAKIGGAKHVAITYDRPDKSSLYVYVVVVTDEYDGDAAKVAESVLAQYEAWGSGNVYEFKNEDVWVTCYGEQELADVISDDLGANDDEALELARQIDAIV